MPQVDPSSFASQVFWLIIIFAALYLIMSRLILPRMTRTLEGRRESIDGDLARAEEMKKQAESVLGAYEALLAEARGRAHAALRASAEAVAADAAQREQELAEALAVRIGEAERRVAAARDEAMESVRDLAAEAAGAMTEQLTGAKPTANQVAAAIKSAAAAAG